VSAHPRIVLRVVRRLTDAADVAPDAAKIAAIWQRVERYVSGERARAAAGGAASSKRDAAAGDLLATVAQMVARTPRSHRPCALRLATRIRASLESVRSAGDHLLLGDRCAQLLASARHAEPLPWLAGAADDLCGRFVRHGAEDEALGVAVSWQIDTILIGH
jgi:hypothetical protein